MERKTYPSKTAVDFTDVFKNNIIVYRELFFLCFVLIYELICGC